MSIKSTLFSLGMKVKPKLPTILVLAGTAVGVGAAVLAVRNGVKLHEVIKEDEETLKHIDEMEADPSTQYVVENGTDEEPTKYAPYDKEAADKDRHEVAKHMTAETIRAYALPIGLSLVAITMIFGGYRMKCKALVAMTASYNAAVASLKTYRKRVADKYGADVERDIWLGRDTEIKESVDEEGNTKIEQVDVVKPASKHLVLRFDSSCSEWRNDPMFLRTIINNLQVTSQVLYEGRSTKHLYLAEVTDALGMERDLTMSGKGWSEKLDPEEGSIKINFAGNTYINEEDGEFVAYIPVDIDGFIC